MYVALAITVPVPVGAKETEQLDVVALTDARVQGLPVNEPVAVPVLVKAMIPAGADAVPAIEVSFTEAVQLVACPVCIVDGEHVTVVEVVRRVTVTVLPVPELPL